MVVGVLLRGDGDAVPEAQRPLVIIFKLDEEQIAPGPDRHGDEPPRRVVHRADALNSVVQSVAKDGIHVHRVQKAQLAAVGHTGHADAVLLAVEALLGEHRVQHLAARLNGGVVNLDGILNLGQVLLPLIVGHDRPQGGHLVLEVVAFAVDEVDIGAGQLVLGLLLAPELLLEVELPLDAQLLPVGHLDPEDEEAAEHGVGLADIVERAAVQREIASGHIAQP